MRESVSLLRSVWVNRNGIGASTSATSRAARCAAGGNRPKRAAMTAAIERFASRASVTYGVAASCASSTTISGTPSAESANSAATFGVAAG